MAYMFCSLHKHIPQHLGSEQHHDRLYNSQQVGQALRVLSPIRTAVAWIPKIPLGNQALRREDFLSLLRAARGPKRSGMEDHVSRGGGPRWSGRWATVVKEWGPQWSGRGDLL